MFGSFPKFHKRNISTEIILKLGCNFCRISLGGFAAYGSGFYSESLLEDIKRRADIKKDQNFDSFSGLS